MSSRFDSWSEIHNQVGLSEAKWNDLIQAWLEIHNPGRSGFSSFSGLSSIMGPGILLRLRCVGSGPLCSPSPGCFPFPTSSSLRPRQQRTATEISIYSRLSSFASAYFLMIGGTLISRLLEISHAIFNFSSQSLSILLYTLAVQLCQATKKTKLAYTISWKATLFIDKQSSAQTCLYVRRTPVYADDCCIPSSQL